MIVPQPTAQYGHVDRVSFARAIFRTRGCAVGGCKSNPKTAAAAPPMVVNFRKSLRVACMVQVPPWDRDKRTAHGIHLILPISNEVKCSTFPRAAGIQFFFRIPATARRSPEGQALAFPAGTPLWLCLGAKPPDFKRFDFVVRSFGRKLGRYRLC